MNTQLENLYFLRDTVIPHMKKNPDRVDLNDWDGSCGRGFCVGGWYDLLSGHDLGSGYRANIIQHFGLTAPEADKLFGIALEATLQARELLIEKIIARKEKELGQSLVVYHPGADIVKDLLKEKVA